MKHCKLGSWPVLSLSLAVGALACEPVVADVDGDSDSGKEASWGGAPDEGADDADGAGIDDDGDSAADPPDDAEPPGEASADEDPGEEPDGTGSTTPDDEAGETGGPDPDGSGGQVLLGLFQSCTLNHITFDFLDGAGATTIGLQGHPVVATVEGDALTFANDIIGGVGGRPFLGGTLTLTVAGPDPDTGALAISGLVEGTFSGVGETIVMEPVVVDPAAVPDLSAAVQATSDFQAALDRLPTAPAHFTGTLSGEPFAYDLRWTIGRDSLNGRYSALCTVEEG